MNLRLVFVLPLVAAMSAIACGTAQSAAGPDGPAAGDDASTNDPRDTEGEVDAGSDANGAGDSTNGAAPDGGGCPGVDLMQSPTSCGACGHDCKGLSCKDGQCGQKVLTTFATPAFAHVLAVGRDAGRIIVVAVEGGAGRDTAPMHVLAIDPKVPNAAPTMIASDLFPGPELFQHVHVADGSVYVVRTTPIAGDAQCTIVKPTDGYCKRVHRVFLNDGHVETWFARSTYNGDFANPFAGFGDRLVQGTSTSLLEYTKSAGPTGRSAGIGPASAVFANANAAYALTNGSLHRISLATFNKTSTTSLASLAVNDSSFFLGTVGSTLYMAVPSPDSKTESLYALDTSSEGTSAVLVRTVSGIAANGSVDVGHAVIEGTGIDLVRKTSYPVASYGYSVVVGDWLYSVTRVDNSGATTVFASPL